MKGKMFSILVNFLMLFSLALFSCGKKTSEGQNVIKIGIVANFGWPLGLDLIHSAEVLVEMENEDGGVTVGSEKYMIELVEYDNKGDQAAAQTAVNKLIFEDNVKIIIFDSSLADACLPITEANKILAIVSTPTPPSLSPENHYSFQAACMNAQFAVLPGWFAQNYPNLKTVIFALPDNQMGHDLSGLVKMSVEPFGFKPTFMFYPANSQDLSSLGTKVKNVNPDFISALAGGTMEPLVVKAVRDAGYKGLVFNLNTATYSGYAARAGEEALEGMISAAWPVEFEPALTPLAREFKEAYIKKFGKWDAPEVQNTAEWGCVIAALEKAGTTDTDKLAEVIGSGLKFECPIGSCEMIPRPDMGNNRTVDSIVAYNMKIVKNGKIEKLATISLDEAKGYFNQVWGKKK